MNVELCRLLDYKYKMIYIYNYDDCRRRQMAELKKEMDKIRPATPKEASNKEIEAVSE
jgi:hypothetical protein